MQQLQFNFSALDVHPHCPFAFHCGLVRQQGVLLSQQMFLLFIVLLVNLVSASIIFLSMGNSDPKGASPDNSQPKVPDTTDTKTTATDLSKWLNTNLAKLTNKYLLLEKRVNTNLSQLTNSYLFFEKKAKFLFG
jgi:hypothetical protein